MVMAANDSDSVKTDTSDKALRLESAGRGLVHDVATPLATIQLNLQFLSNYLPLLLSQRGASNAAESAINPDHLKALMSLPSVLEDDIRKIRHAVQQFSSALIAENPLPSAPAEPVTPRLQVSSMRMLLVEDELVHQEITRKQVEGRCQIDVAANGRDALEKVTQGAYDLVLLDLMLSGQDARSLVGELRSAAQKHLRVILVSNMPLSTEEVRQLKADGALEKPFRFSNLEELLRTSQITPNDEN